MKIILDDNSIRFISNKLNETYWIFGSELKVYIDYLKNSYITFKYGGEIVSNIDSKDFKLENGELEIEYDEDYLFIESNGFIEILGEHVELVDPSYEHIVSNNQKMMTSGCSSEILKLLIKKINHV